MTDDPIWPGVDEYLYHAARWELVSSDGTWIVPSELSPRCSSFESTPMAGISTDTGSERGSDGPRAESITPAADFEGWGACTWAPTATPRAAVPAAMSRAPVTPASRARGLRAVLGGGA